MLAVATSDTNTVFLFRRKGDGSFEDMPYSAINGAESRLNYPHDLSFSLSGDTELLAVAQRAGSICMYQRNTLNDDYSANPVCEISGPASRLSYSDGVAFVPPDNEYLAACNLRNNTITFYRKMPGSTNFFERDPAFVLKHRSISRPDGLAFSQCGKWLAVANHGKHTVGIYERRHAMFSRAGLRYGPRPVTIIADRTLRFPHSVAFTPQTNHLVVTNAGANYFSVYQPERHYSKTRWSQSPVVQKPLGPDVIFKEVNARNKMEGGPKGVAIHRNSLAICSPEYGVKIYRFHENLSNY